MKSAETGHGDPRQRIYFITDFLFQSEFCEENHTLLLLLVLGTDSRTLNKLASVLNLNYTPSQEIETLIFTCEIGNLSMSSGITKRKIMYFISSIFLWA